MKKLILTIISIIFAIMTVGCSGQRASETPKNSSPITVTVPELPSISADAPLYITDEGLYTYDLDGDGTAETFLIDHISDTSVSDYIFRITVYGSDRSDSSAIMMASSFEAAAVYDVDGNGLSELFIGLDTSDSDYATWLFNYDGARLISSEKIADGIPVPPAAHGCIYSLADNSVWLSDFIDILGTWACVREFMFSQTDLSVTPRTDSLWIGCISAFGNADDYWKRTSLITLDSLTVTDISGNPLALPGGTGLLLEYTDGESLIWFVTDKDVHGLIRLTKASDGQGFLINGIPENRLFKSVSYAG